MRSGVTKVYFLIALKSIKSTNFKLALTTSIEDSPRAHGLGHLRCLRSANQRTGWSKINPITDSDTFHSANTSVARFKWSARKINRKMDQR